MIRATDLHSKHLSKTTGLTSPQILLLHTIREKGEVTIGEIAQEMSLSQATVTTIIDRLEKRQLVFRERSTADKRKVHAYLTEKGEVLLQDAPTPLQQNFINKFQKLEEWEQSLLLSSVQRISSMMNAEDIDVAPVLELGSITKPE